MNLLFSLLQLSFLSSTGKVAHRKGTVSRGIIYFPRVDPRGNNTRWTENTMEYSRPRGVTVHNIASYNGFSQEYQLEKLEISKLLSQYSNLHLYVWDCVTSEMRVKTSFPPSIYRQMTNGVFKMALCCLLDHSHSFFLFV